MGRVLTAPMIENPYDVPNALEVNFARSDPPSRF
jgi:hypothetical protein